MNLFHFSVVIYAEYVLLLINTLYAGAYSSTHCAKGGETSQISRSLEPQEPALFNS